MFLEGTRFFQLLEMYYTIDTLNSFSLMQNIRRLRHPIEFRGVEGKKFSLFKDKKDVRDLSLLLASLNVPEYLDLRTLALLIFGEFYSCRPKIGASLSTIVEATIFDIVAKGSVPQADVNLLMAALPAMSQPAQILAIQFLDLMTSRGNKDLDVQSSIFDVPALQQLSGAIFCDNGSPQLIETILRLFINLTNNLEFCSKLAESRWDVLSRLSHLYLNSPLSQCEIPMLVVILLSNLAEKFPSCITRFSATAIPFSSEIAATDRESILSSAVNLFMQLYKAELCESSDDTMNHLLLPYLSLFISYCIIGQPSIRQFVLDKLEGYSLSCFTGPINDLLKLHSLCDPEDATTSAVRQEQSSVIEDFKKVIQQLQSL